MTEPIFAYEPRNFAGMDDLIELALDLRWSWDHGADDIWRLLAPELWDLTRNPWVILQTIASEKLKAMCADAEFLRPGEKAGPGDARLPAAPPPGFRRRRLKRR